MLARYMLASCVCTVTGRFCIETAARYGLIFLHTSFPRPMLRCVLGKLEYLKIKVLPSETLSQTLDVENFATEPNVGQRDINNRPRRSIVDST